VRNRPLSAKEVAKSTYETVKVLEDRVAVLLDPGFELNPDDVLRKNRNKELQFAFDYVFDKNIG
jgi:kinesin family member 18/19